MASRHLHWPEYLIEAAALGMFMISATTVATVLQHPGSPASHALSVPALRRIPMGLAMGLTAIAIIYSPFGQRSGAHMNPAVTLTFLRLGKIAALDAAGYVIAQFAGGLAGVGLAVLLLAGLPADPSVNFIATTPGADGTAVAFLSEATISFAMMLTVLHLSNHPTHARYTGLAAGILVAVYIVVEAPLSGMSMNPARSFGPAVLAHTARSLWIYFTAPLLGMLCAAEWFVRTWGRERIRCAKLHHVTGVRCIFHCGYSSSFSEKHA